MKYPIIGIFLDKGDLTMRLRPPATPLITIDPYFSVWSDADELNSKYTIHWTGKEHSIIGHLIIDGTAYRFMGMQFNLIVQRKEELLWQP